MKKFLKNYEFTLTVKGPVHIGDGKTLTKVDYFFYKDRIYFPNLHKMLFALSPRSSIVFKSVPSRSKISAL